MITLDQFYKLLPLACEWAEQQEKYILEYGVPLDYEQEIDAYLIGVNDIKKVRLLKVDQIPVPSHPELKNMAEVLGFFTPNTMAITYRYGIYIKSEYWNQRHLVAHELVHTMQYERSGGFKPFLGEYLNECITLGYPNGPLELEAKRIEEEICKDD